MFQNKKFKSIFIAETIMPWGVFVLVEVASAFYKAWFRSRGEEAERAYRFFDFFYDCAMWYGIGVNVVLFMVGFVSFVMMLVHLFGVKKEQEYSVVRPLIIWLWSGPCILGTFIFMFIGAALRF